MKSFAFVGLALVAGFSFSACDPKPSGRREVATVSQTREVRETRPGSATLNPVDSGRTSTRTEETTVETGTPSNVIPEPTPRRNPEYGVKIEGKSGYVKSPYDAAGRPIDVRGLPPGTEVEDPYTPGRTLLVP